MASPQIPTPRLGEIYFVPLGTYRLGVSGTGHFCVVTAVAGNRVLANMLASSPASYTPGQDFLIEAAAQDFAATGLFRTTYAIRHVEAELAVAKLGARHGCFQGELKRRFEEWWGATL